MELSIIIVTYNSEDVIEKCLSSLKEYPPSCEYETIVIDNASTDGTS
ncbi:glycosyltransferase, partial [bacterium]|nr:glycosyltransferase [bacterium]